jgi:hypothetical protein
MKMSAQQQAAMEGLGLHLEDGFTVVHTYRHQVSHAYREGIEPLVADGEKHASDIYGMIAAWLLEHEDELEEAAA